MVENTEIMRNELRSEKRLISRIGLAYFSFLAVAFVVSVVITILTARFFSEIFNASWYVYLLSAVSIYLFAFPVLLLVLNKVPAVSLEKNRDMKAGEFFICLTICISIACIGNLIGQGICYGISTLTGIEPVNTVSEVIQHSDLIWTTLFVLLLAPIMEEVIFRKLLIDRMVKYGEGTAIMTSALFFGLFHQNLYQFFYAFGLGLVFAYIYIRTGKLRYTIGLHFGINLLLGVVSTSIISIGSVGEALDYMTKAASYEDVFANMNAGTMIGMAIYFVYIFALLAVVIAGVILLIDSKKKIVLNRENEILPKGKRFSTVYLNLGVALCIVFGALITASNFFFA